MKTLGEKMLARVRDFPQAKSSWHGPAQPHEEAIYRLEEEAEGFRLCGEFVDADKLSVQALRLQVAAAQAPEAIAFDARRLRHQAEEIVRRASYLTEKLELVELDQNNGKAQIRSSAPRREPHGTSYFEIVLMGNRELSICRYEYAEHAASRQPVSFVIAQEMIERLVNDFIAVLSMR